MYLKENTVNSTKWYHGSKFEFESFDDFKTKGPSALGIFATSDKTLAEIFGDYVYEVELNVKNLYKITMDYWDDIRGEHWNNTSYFENMRTRLMGKGYDGVYIGSRSFTTTGDLVFKDGAMIVVFDKKDINIIDKSKNI